ncbi:MAG: GNAT family N-acetyltransferase [Gemmatimonadaceae bacterium]|nr:GNAT family N-acetyltransferase [Gemmatimonadaceae bacterium]
MSFTIRPAQPNDRTAVIVLAPRLEAFGPPANIPPNELAVAEARALNDAFDQMPSGSALYVAVDASGTVIGSIFLETKVDYFTQRPHGHVGILTVAREAEGQGVGRALLGAADEWGLANGYDRLTLFVFEKNVRARALYERADYAPDLVRYRKDLASRT